MASRLPSSAFTSSLSQCIRPQCASQASHQWHTRNFSQSCRREQTGLRRQMYEWLNGPGAKLRHPLPGSTNYLGAYDRQGNLIRAGNRPKPQREGEESSSSEDGGLEAEAQPDELAQNEDGLPPESKEDLHPFPLNTHFYSQSVLSEELREKIYEEVVLEKTPISVVSSSFKVTMERVAAVVRLKALEKQSEALEKPMAKPYAKAVLQMLPTTKLAIDLRRQPVHESIADIPVHPATRQQIFYPTSESRHFTREDAAKAFANDLLPADKRIPHPDLVEAERDEFLGLPFDERVDRQQQRNQKHEEERVRKAKKAAEKAAKTQAVPGRRWDFHFQDFSVEQVGRDGKSPAGVGWRYGAPHEDRKRGQIKIPKRVDA
ncbi:putative ribosomal protein s35 mitochondrial protein [Neofusicoccum parvum]|uniref:Ribosomal protein s35 mitochondrial protein n=1 Tax=Neofusicoccum parvum TaxID=310453 RepID=A0ACB5RQK6_9PEZI|nr:putative ribosomal protein s35 mitochondrial protein [Neofusicoccum parvum]